MIEPVAQSQHKVSRSLALLLSCSEVSDGIRAADVSPFYRTLSPIAAAAQKPDLRELNASLEPYPRGLVDCIGLAA